MIQRWTKTVTAVCRVLLDANPEPVWGFDVMRAVGNKSGTVYPILRRLEESGWVTSEWEDPEDVTRYESRPPRRYYFLTELGESSIRKKLEQ